AAFSRKLPQEALNELSDRPVKELELTTFGGEPVYIATLDRGETRVVTIGGAPQATFDPHRIAQLVTDASGRRTSVRVLDRYDAYYLDRRRRRPLPVVLAQLNDADRTRYYINPGTARVVATYSANNWTARWLYHGLHSLDFPWLYAHRPLWDIVVIAFMAGGTRLGVASPLLRWRVLRRALSASAGGTAERSVTGDSVSDHS